MTSDALAERPDSALVTSDSAPTVTASPTGSTPIGPKATGPTVNGPEATGPTTNRTEAGRSTTDGPEATGPATNGSQVSGPAVTGAAWRVRPARPGDVIRIHALVRELAEYEREPDAVKATPEDFGAAFFNPHPRVHCHVVEVHGPDGPNVVGLAIWFVTFSTWRGRHGLWLEDLYVQPAYRRLGVGRALLVELAGICMDRGYARMEWWVLDWNEPAQRFYRGVGADPQDDWTVWRVTEESLKALADRPK
jgi:GNAT superfamily N-acetyltransferase